MAVIALLLFCLTLAGALALDVSLVCALAIGWGIFSCCALLRGAGAGGVLRLTLEGARTVLPICTTMVCIGLLTAAWRASGTIACLVDLALGLITPDLFVPCVFLCNCAISFLLGSSMATAATMGVISMAVAAALDCPQALAGGAMLAGCYFGDRCSPLSTSSLLTATLAGTTVRRLIPHLMKSCLPAFAASVALYCICSPAGPSQGRLLDAGAFFAREYHLSWPLVIPPLLVLALSALRAPVGRTVLAGALAAAVLCLCCQDMDPADLPRTLVAGYEARDPEVARLMNGGGILSMATVIGIVCISSSYAGLLRAAGFLDSLHGIAARLRRRGPFAPYLGTGLVTSAFACSQTLAIMLTHQIIGRDGDVTPLRHALDMEDSVVLLAALIPWNIAVAVPLAMTGAPLASLPLAFYLWLLPLSRLLWTPRGV